jgi:hypothetical protein
LIKNVVSVNSKSCHDSCDWLIENSLVIGQSYLSLTQLKATIKNTSIFITEKDSLAILDQKFFNIRRSGINMIDNLFLWFANFIEQGWWESFFLMGRIALTEIDVKRGRGINSAKLGDWKLVG